MFLRVRRKCRDIYMQKLRYLCCARNFETSKDYRKARQVKSPTFLYLYSSEFNL